MLIGYFLQQSIEIDGLLKEQKEIQQELKKAIRTGTADRLLAVCLLNWNYHTPQDVCTLPDDKDRSPADLILERWECNPTVVLELLLALQSVYRGEIRRTDMNWAIEIPATPLLEVTGANQMSPLDKAIGIGGLILQACMQAVLDDEEQISEMHAQGYESYLWRKARDERDTLNKSLEVAAPARATRLLSL